MMRGDSVAAVWPTLSITSDRFSKSSQGIILTFVMLWDAQTNFQTWCLQASCFPVGLNECDAAVPPTASLGGASSMPSFS